MQADRAGADFIVAQGTEGGGHTGYVGTLVLTPSVVDAVEAPVLAAGGIVDGRGLAAVRCLGAQGAWMGTRFIATTEAYGHPAYKQRVVDSASRDAVISRAYTGKPLRTLQNEWTREWAQRVDEIEPFPAQYAVAGVRVESGYQDGDVEQGMMPAGQAVEGIHDIRPAGDIVRAIVAEAEQILAASRGRESLADVQRVGVRAGEAAGVGERCHHDVIAVPERGDYRAAQDLEVLRRRTRLAEQAARGEPGLPLRPHVLDLGGPVNLADRAILRCTTTRPGRDRKE